MSSGTYMQLVAKGSEDIFLTGNPEISFFKSVYKKHTNFAKEINKLTIPKSNLQYTQDTKCSVVIPRNGDLLYATFLGFQLPHIYSNDTYKFRWIKYLGNNIIDKAIIYINGQKIEEISGEFLTIDNELNQTDNKKQLYYNLIGHTPELYEPEYAYKRNGFYPTSSLDSTDKLNYNKPPSIESHTIYVPLNFWFCKSSGLSLPLIALQKSEVRIEFTFKALYKLYKLYDSTTKKYIRPNLGISEHKLNNFMSHKIQPAQPISNLTDFDFDIHLEATYIHLDNEERRTFAVSSHTYLIKSVKKYSETNLTPGIISLNIRSSHPVSELFITAQRTDFEERNDYNNYTNWSSDVPEWQQVNFLPEFSKIAGSIEISQNSYWDYNTESQNTIRFSRDTTSGALVLEKYHNGQYHEMFRFDTDAETNPGLPSQIINENISQFYNNQTKDIIQTCQIYFDGRNKLSEDEGRANEFFTKLQPYLYHRGNSIDGVLVYSFALNPWDDLQPSGTINMTRVDKLLLKLNTVLPKTTNNSYNYKFNINTYLISYNIVNIASGIGGLKFAL